MNKNIKPVINKYMPIIKKTLEENGLSLLNCFRIKVVAPDRLKDPNWLACYRGNSIFSSVPIFWVRRDFYNKAEKEIKKINKTYGHCLSCSIDSEIEQDFYKTIMHEIVHAICDLRYRYPDMDARIDDISSNEEEFAENMAESIMNNTFKAEPCYRVIKKCLKDFYS